MATDSRHAYFTRCISAFTGIDPCPPFVDPEPLATFLDDPACSALRAQLCAEGRVLLSTTFPSYVVNLAAQHTEVY